MKSDDYQRAIVDLIKRDPLRASVLDAVQRLGIDSAYVGAGFVRNLVWDHLHGLKVPTPLNDVDVIFFDSTISAPDHQELEKRLEETLPTVYWQVRNQALMHQRNGDRPYTSCVDAMAFWPEKETAVAIRQIGPQKAGEEPSYECISAFGFESLFNGLITVNPKRGQETFEQRVASKGWLERWPQLRVTRT